MVSAFSFICSSSPWRSTNLLLIMTTLYVHIFCKWLHEAPLEASVCWTWQIVSYLTTSSASRWVRYSRSWTQYLAWWVQPAHACALKICFKTTFTTLRLSLQLMLDRHNLVLFGFTVPSHSDYWHEWYCAVNDCLNSARSLTTAEWDFVSVVLRSFRSRGRAV
jgi:hypothetical protein